MGLTLDGEFLRLDRMIDIDSPAAVYLSDISESNFK